MYFEFSVKTTRVEGTFYRISKVGKVQKSGSG